MMIKRFFFTFLLLISVFTNAQNISVRVMTMNIREGGQLAGYVADSFCTCIRTYDPDVVVFQEMDNFTKRNGNKDILSEMAVKLGMFPYFGRSFTYDSGAFGNAILSKYPFYNAHTITSKPSGASEARGCSWIDIALPNKRTVRIGVTHLEVSSEQARITNLAAFNASILTGSTIPTLLLGDFNASPESATIVYALNKWQDIGAGTGYTYSSTNPTSRIDYIMGYPKKWVKSSYKIVSYPKLSDHCFVVADLLFP